MQPLYFPTLDHAGQQAIQWILARHPADRVFAGYRDRGFDVRDLSDVDRLPPDAVEERVSRLREYWRRWLFGESAAALVMGPAGLVVGGPFISLVLLAWSVEMGWAYGHDMAEEDRIDRLRRIIHRRLMGALGFPMGGSGLNGWRRLMGTLLFWGFGPELNAADRVMAEIRDEFRRDWEDRRSLSTPFTAATTPFTPKSR